jgi:hypothetical protein
MVSAQFIDVPAGYWAEAYINAIYNSNITTGCSQNPLKYCPEDCVTREQMAAFIVRAVEGEPPLNYCDSGKPFPDVTPDMWSCRYIKRLKELGITTGYADGRYGPYDLVPREQMAAFLVRAVEGEPPLNYCDSGSLFTDITPYMWSCRYIKRLKELGITTGYGDGRYGPYDFVTRAQMAAFLTRAFLEDTLGLTISSLSTSSADPFSLLTITGSGFHPVNSAISVLFVPNGSGVPIAVPAFSASADSLQVVVPPFLNRTSGFSSGVMNVQAIQVSGSSLMTSNTIGGLNVGSLPSIPSSNLPGAVTGAWINSGLIVLQNIQTFAGSTPSYADLLSASNALGSDMTSSLQAIDSIKANPTQTQNLATVDGSPFVLDAATLAASDRLVLAYLQQFLSFVQTQPATSLTTTVLHRSAQATCVADLDPVTLTMICDGRAYNQQFAQVGSAILPPAAAFVYGQWLSLAGAFGAAELLAAGVSEAAVNAFQLVWAASGPYFSALAAGGPAPPLKEPATEVATTLVDIQLSPLGTMLSGVLFAAELVSEANKVSSAPMGSAPRGGLIVSDPTTQPPPGSNALLRVQGFGDSATALSVMAPESQAIVPLSSDTGDSCCVSTDGCQSETLYTCPGSCCCCPDGARCGLSVSGWACGGQ